MEPLDRSGGGAIARLRRCILEIMRKVRTHHEQGPSIHNGANEGRNVLRRGIAHKQRYEREVPDHSLEKRQLDLERMLGRVRPVIRADNTLVYKVADGIDIDWNISKR